MGVTARQTVDKMRDLIGINKRTLIDIYNSHRPLALNFKVQYTDSWCDTGISALFIMLDAVDLIGGTECGVERHIQLFKKAGIWIEDGTITPIPGDIITYNWDDSTQPNDGFADHIGLVEKVENGKIAIIECNYNDAVRRREIPIGWGYIRGYARPKYDDAKASQNEVSVSAAKNTLNGIDISGWQPNIDVKKIEADFVIVKATQGTGYISPSWEKQIQDTISSGKIPLLYHYANGSGVAGEVNFFLQTVADYIGKVGFALDWETSENSSGKNSQYGNPAYAKQFMDEIKKRTGVTVLLYGSKDSCINAMDWAATHAEGYPLWGAQYANYNPMYGYNANPWQSDRAWGPWGVRPSIHQYTSNLRLAGYDGGLDGNLAYMTEEQMRALFETGKKLETVVVQPAESEKLDKASLLELVADTMDGLNGIDDVRKEKLGSRYDDVQAMITYIYNTDAGQLATDTISGKFGNNPLRKRVLHHRYDEVQNIVTQRLKVTVPITEIAKQVINGEFGNEPERTPNLRKKGYDSAAVQKEVNRILGYAA